MNIGILTFHRAHNYGAILQCYALQEVLRSRGYNVEIIDYRQPFIDWLYSPRLSIKKLLKALVTFKFSRFFFEFSEYKKAQIRQDIFCSFRDKYLHCSEIADSKSIPLSYDRYIIGSDQVWGIHCTNVYDPIYWGNFRRPKNSLLFGYAISANGDYKNYLSNDQIIKNVNNFNDISFREISVRDEIKKITGQNKGISLDPTLLTDVAIWEPLINSKWKNRKYVVVYQIRRMRSIPDLLEQRASEYAKLNQCEVVDLTQMLYSVEDFVSAIRYSQCVFTSSFHATVFSILFGTPFWAFKLGDGHDGRYSNLLYELDLEKHLVDYMSNVMKPIMIDRDSVKFRLDKLKKTSVEYLARLVL